MSSTTTEPEQVAADIAAFLETNYSSAVKVLS